MFKHIVMWKLRADAADQGPELKRRLETLSVLPGVAQLEVGLDTVRSPASWDVVLVTAFPSIEEYEAYRDHPDHLAVVEFVKQVVCDRAVVDFEA